MKKTPLKRSTNPLKRTKLKKKSKDTITSLKKKIYKKILEQIRGDKKEMRCYTCDLFYPIKKIQGSHFISKRYNATCFHKDNIRGACWLCNGRYGGKGHIFAQKLISEIGLDRFNEMIDLSKQRKEFKINELREILDSYNKE